MSDPSPYHPGMSGDILALWQRAAGAHLPIMPEVWTANTSGDKSFRPADLLVAERRGRMTGFVLTKRWRDPFPGLDRYEPIGYIALMAVDPRHQGRGIGRDLLQAAEARLRSEGAARIVLGGSGHHFLAGLPDWAMTARHLALQAGYTPGSAVWDVRRRLTRGPALPPATLPAGFRLRPFRHGEEGALMAFLSAAFPGRWARDIAHDLDSGHPVTEVMGLFDATGPCGFARLHPPYSPGTWRWAGLAPGIAGLGPIGVAGEQRGKGLGLGLLVAGLTELARKGADDTLIDWTDLLAFYQRVGFEPWLRYTLMAKDLP